MVISEVVLTAKAGVDAAKTALDIANKLQNVELKSAILDLKEELLVLREENLTLKEELSKQAQYNMEFENNVYWNIKEDGTKEGPYCSVCWDGKNKAIRLKSFYNGYYQCGSCKNEFCNTP